MNKFFRPKVALLLTISTVLFSGTNGISADSSKAKPADKHMAEWILHQGKLEAEKVYKFRAQNSRSVYFRSEAAKRPGQNAAPPSVMLHSREYIRQGSKTVLIMFPGLRSPDAKHGILVERLWEKAPETDFLVVEPRSQGRSGSLADDNWSVLHIEDYHEYLEDFYQYVKMIHSQNKYDKIVLTAHSTAGFMLTLALIKYPDMQDMVSKVVLNAPAFDMSPKIFGNYDSPIRLPLRLSDLVARTLKFFKIKNSQSILPGYPKKYVRIDPQAPNKIIKSPMFYAVYKRLVELEEESTDIPQGSSDELAPIVERIGPTVSWLMNMWAAQKDLKTADLKSLRVPIEILTATKDSLVNNRFTEDLCKRMPNCKIQKVVGYHEILFDIPEISDHFDRAILESLGQIAPKIEQNPTVVIAHRGLSGTSPESTAISYELAARAGADFLEGDIQLTRDGKLVVMHDDTLLRTTNVKEKFPGRSTYRVHDFTWQELSTLDSGSWFNRKNPQLAQTRFTGQKIITVQMLLEIASRYKKGLYLEIKDSKQQPRVIEKLVEVLKSEGWIGADGSQLKEQKIVFQSFQTSDLAQIKKLAPKSERLFLISALKLKGPSREEIQEVAQYVSPHVFMLKLHKWNPLAVFGLFKRYFQFLKDRGYSIEAWTVNKKSDFVNLYKQGVSGLFTDRAELVVKWRNELQAIEKQETLNSFGNNEASDAGIENGTKASNCLNSFQNPK